MDTIGYDSSGLTFEDGYVIFDKLIEAAPGENQGKNVRIKLKEGQTPIDFLMQTHEAREAGRKAGEAASRRFKRIIEDEKANKEALHLKRRSLMKLV